MKYFANILYALRSIASNLKIWIRVFVLVAACFIGAIMFSKTRVKIDPECEKQREQLINALIEIKKDLQNMGGNQAAVKTSAATMVRYGLFADTTRPVKRIIQQDQMQQRQIKKVLYKIDSILIENSKQQQQKQKV